MYNSGVNASGMYASPVFNHGLVDFARLDIY
jgi:hypothetical protein